MPTRKVGSYFDSTPAIQSLIKQVQCLIDMQQVFTEIAPKPLAQSGRVGRFAHSSLLLFADNGAMAAKLKQLTPSLLINFQKRGYKVTAIRVEVQPPHPRTPLPRKTGLSGKALNHVHELAARLPDSPLRTAVQNMLARASNNEDQPLEHKQHHGHQEKNDEKFE
ncbi:MAG TPA: DciA family protein [Burkholderiales bacterium]|nr:DciA family protein [Burkholderiales bacterium]